MTFFSHFLFVDCFVFFGKNVETVLFKNAHSPTFNRYIIYQDQTVGSHFIGLYILQLSVGHTVYLILPLEVRISGSMTTRV